MIYLLFFANSKSQRINKRNKLTLIKKSTAEKKKINQNFNIERMQLINSSKKLMFFFLLLDLIVYTVLIIKKEYLDIIGIIGGILLPFLVYPNWRKRLACAFIIYKNRQSFLLI